MRKYNKCGVDFTEQEYKNIEVVNQVERKTVEFIFCNSIFLSMIFIRFIFYVLYILVLVFVQF